MTGEEHYLEAERLTAEAAEAMAGSDTQVKLAQVAGVHATLALASATLDPTAGAEYGVGSWR